MRPELLLLALMSTAGNAEARDPFEPPLEIRCEVGKHLQIKWKLLGVTEQDRQFVSWFLSPQGDLTGIKPGESLAGSNWTVALITTQGVTLQGILPCESLRMILPLQGVKIEKDATRVNAIQLRDNG